MNSNLSRAGFWVRLHSEKMAELAQIAQSFHTFNGTSRNDFSAESKALEYSFRHSSFYINIF